MSYDFPGTIGKFDDNVRVFAGKLKVLCGLPINGGLWEMIQMLFAMLTFFSTIEHVHLRAFLPQIFLVQLMSSFKDNKSM